MLKVEELHLLIDESVLPLEARSISLSETRGLVSAESILADSDQPTADHSAMDGYAVREDAESGTFLQTGTILPGQPPLPSPQKGEALRVFTGSLIPEGVKVVMQEDVDSQGEKLRILSMERSGYVRKKGSTARRGDVLLSEGSILTPAALGILAGAGVLMPKVIPRPSVAHLTTGSEIVSMEFQPREGQVRNTNAPLIRSLLEESNAVPLIHRHASESLEECLAICRSPDFAQADLLLVSGGASVGDHDHSAELIEVLDFQLLCRKVSCRPGKPFLLGIQGHRVAIGLPGNPLSHFVSFHLFVKRVLRHLSGLPTLPLMKGIVRDASVLSQGQLETYWPAVWKLGSNGVEVTPKPWLNSGHLSALAGVNALLRIQAGLQPPKDGETASFLICGDPVITIK